MIGKATELKLSKALRKLGDLPQSVFIESFDDLFNDFTVDLINVEADQFKSICRRAGLTRLRWERLAERLEKRKSELLGVSLGSIDGKFSDRDRNRLVERIVDEFRRREDLERRYANERERLSANLQNLSNELSDAKKKIKAEGVKFRRRKKELEKEYDEKKAQLNDEVANEYGADLKELRDAETENAEKAILQRQWFIGSVGATVAFAITLIMVFFSNSSVVTMNESSKSASYILVSNEGSLPANTESYFPRPQSPLEYFPWIVLLVLLTSPFVWVARIFSHQADKSEILRWDFFSRRYMEQRMLLYYARQDEELRTKILGDYSSSWISNNPADRLLTVKVQSNDPMKTHPIEIAIEALKKNGEKT